MDKRLNFTIDDLIKETTEHFNTMFEETANTRFIVEEHSDNKDNIYYLVFNDIFEEPALSKTDDEVREVVRSYGTGFSKYLIFIKGVMTDFYNDEVQFKTYVNNDIMIYNSQYKLRITRDISFVPDNNRFKLN